jgi:transposase
MNKKSIKRFLIQFEQIKEKIKIMEKILNEESNKEIIKDSSTQRCHICNCKNMRVRMDKSYFCRSCGFDSQKEKNGN